MPQRTRDVVLLAAVALSLTGANLLFRSLVPHTPAAIPAEIFRTSTSNASVVVLALGLVLLLAVRKIAARPRPRHFPQRRPHGWE